MSMGSEHSFNALKRTLLCIGLLALGACATMEAKETSQRLPDGTELHYARMRDENPGGMDVTVTVVSRCATAANGQVACEIINASNGYQEGGLRTLFHGAGTVAIGGAAYAVGQGLRRPDRTSIGQNVENENDNDIDTNVTSGNASSSSSIRFPPYRHRGGHHH